MTLVKICGITRAHDAASIAAAGADFLGFNFWPRSKRHVTAAHAVGLAEVARAAGTAKLVGVFVDADPAEIAATVARVKLDIVQLHGDETELAAISTAAGVPVWKAVPGRREQIDRLGALDAAAILMDTPSIDRGGSGVAFDWEIAAEAIQAHPKLRLVLAGGLTPESVAAAIAAVGPWAVDVASGVESAPGIKDLARVESFIRAAARTGLSPATPA